MIQVSIFLGQVLTRFWDFVQREWGLVDCLKRWFRWRRVAAGEQRMPSIDNAGTRVSHRWGHHAQNPPRLAVFHVGIGRSSQSFTVGKYFQNCSWCQFMLDQTPEPNFTPNQAPKEFGPSMRGPILLMILYIFAAIRNVGSPCVLDTLEWFKRVVHCSRLHGHLRRRTCVLTA